jgi:hypothetical protein
MFLTRHVKEAGVLTPVSFVRSREIDFNRHYGRSETIKPATRAKVDRFAPHATSKY